jgi:hypothetical protein
MIEPLRFDVELDCPPAHAFATWAERFGTWWPRSHTVSGVPSTEVVLQPHVGGRIFERTADGSQIDWGEITVYEPPVRIRYLWHLRRDRSDATDVELVFHPLAGDRCRLEVVHTGWEHLGADAQRWRDANHGGWEGLLPHYVAAVATEQLEEKA